MHTPPVDENFRGVPIDGKNSEESGKNTLIHRNLRGVWRKMLSSTGISEGSGEKCSHPHTELSAGSGEKCTHPQEFQSVLIHIPEFQRGLEKNALIHRNFRGVWRDMLSSTGISEGSGEKCSHPHTDISVGSGEKCTHPQEFQSVLVHIQEFQRGLEKSALIHRNFRGV